METSDAGEDMDVLEAEAVYLLMKKECRISRSVRAQWFLEHLNTSITIRRRNSLEDCQSELTVISVIPNHPPSDWKIESSHMYKYLVTSHSSVIFLTHKYRIVYCLDMSPSLSAVDIQHGEVMIDEMFLSLKRSLNGLTMPFLVPGSSILFQPEIFVTVIAHTPFFTTPAQQVCLDNNKDAKRIKHVSEGVKEFILNLIHQMLEQFGSPQAMVRKEDWPSPCLPPMRLVKRYLLCPIPVTASKGEPTRECIVCSRTEKTSTKRKETRYECDKCSGSHFVHPSMEISLSCEISVKL